jgi:hypothetical protein
VWKIERRAPMVIVERKIIVRGCSVRMGIGLRWAPVVATGGGAAPFRGLV